MSFFPHDPSQHVVVGPVEVDLQWGALAINTQDEETARPVDVLHGGAAAQVVIVVAKDLVGGLLRTPGEVEREIGGDCSGIGRKPEGDFLFGAEKLANDSLDARADAFDVDADWDIGQYHSGIALRVADAEVGTIGQKGSTIGRIENLALLAVEQFLQRAAHGQHFEHTAAARLEAGCLGREEFGVLQLRAELLFALVDFPDDVVGLCCHAILRFVVRLANVAELFRSAIVLRCLTRIFIPYAFQQFTATQVDNC